MLTVYGFTRARSTRVLWMLEEIGAEYRYVHVDLGQGEGQKPPYIELNPGGKVPTLVDDQFVLTESAAILTYLGDKFPQAGLLPPVGSHDRARYLQWAFFILTELEQPLWTIAKHKFVFPKERRLPQIFDTAAWEFERAARVLDKALRERDFLIGEQFSAGDILAAHTLAWAKAFKVELPTPDLERYAALHLARPALARAQAKETNPEG